MPHSLQLLHDDLCGIHVRLVVAGDGDGHVEAVGITGLRQQLLGLFGVVSIVVGQLIIKYLLKAGYMLEPSRVP